MIGNGHAGFGRGALEKGRKAPRPRPTSAILDPAFGLGFIKICSYFPYPLKMWVNGHLRHEAPLNPSGDERAPPPVCRSSLAKLRAA